MTKQLLVAGGGIGGVSAAIAASRAGWHIRLFERAPVFSEVGAGVQLGPNVVRRLQAWGLHKALLAVAAAPQQLQVRSASDGRVLGAMALGASMVQRYGAAYLTVHRADLHQLLLDEAGQCADLGVYAGQEVLSLAQSEGVVTVHTTGQDGVEGDALVVADGVWSRLRSQLLGDGRPQATGHLAYRALVAQKDLPQALRTSQVTAWLGPRLHVVQYPVRRGELQNLVVIVQGPAPDDMERWDHTANAADLERVLAACCTPLQDLVRGVTGVGQDWRLWPLSGRPLVQGPQQMAQGLVALLGDAAHPMLPYLAQGAGMAIEDAAELQQALAMHDLDVDLRLRRYALNRWQRNARVQARSQRNGRIFHATGAVRWGRDLAMGLLGERLMDVPWLYRGDGSQAVTL